MDDNCSNGGSGYKCLQANYRVIIAFIWISFTTLISLPFSELFGDQVAGRNANFLNEQQKHDIASNFLPNIWGKLGENYGPEMPDKAWMYLCHTSIPHQTGYIGYDVVDVGFSDLLAIEYTVFLDFDLKNYTAYTQTHCFDAEGFTVLIKPCAQCRSGWEALSVQTIGHEKTAYETMDRLLPFEINRLADTGIFMAEGSHALYTHRAVCERQHWDYEDCARDPLQSNPLINPHCVLGPYYAESCSCNSADLECLDENISNPNCWAERLKLFGYNFPQTGCDLCPGVSSLWDHAKQIPPYVAVEKAVPENLGFVELFEEVGFQANASHRSPNDADERENFGDALVDAGMPLRLINFPYWSWWKQYYFPSYQLDQLNERENFGLRRDIFQHSYWTKHDHWGLADRIRSLKLHGLPGTILVLRDYYDINGWYVNDELIKVVPDGARSFEISDLGDLKDKFDFVTWGFGPTADAGPDRTIFCDEPLTLDASGSFRYAPDQQTLTEVYGLSNFDFRTRWSYSWYDETTSTLLGTWPEVVLYHLSTGTHRIRLEVSGERYISPDNPSQHSRVTVRDWCNVTVTRPTYVIVDFPNGGERLCAGSNYSISWHPKCNSENVKIDYSVDGGLSWITIYPDVWNDGGGPWVTPRVISNHCRLRVTALSGAFTGMSGSDFALTQDYPSTIPAVNEHNIPTQQVVQVVFPNDVDESLVNDSTLVVFSQLTGRLHGTFVYDRPTRTASFDPDVDLLSGDLVTAILKSDSASSQSLPICNNWVWSFSSSARSAAADFNERRDFALGHAPQALVAADLNKDGAIDLISGNVGVGGVSILLNDGHGNFPSCVDYLVGDSIVAFTTGDFDADYDVDLALVSQNMTILLNNGDGSLKTDSVYRYYIGTSLVPADVDADGDLDLLLSNFGQGGVAYNVNGHGVFWNQHSFNGGGCGQLSFALKVGDLDNDGDIDLVTISGGFPLHPGHHCVAPLRNRGDGWFDNALRYDIWWANDLVLADLNNDRSLDIGITTYNETDSTSQLYVLMNNGNAEFPYSPRSYTLPRGASDITYGDFDGDADMDLAITSSLEDKVTILFNVGDGSFGSSVSFTVPGNPQGLCAADFDGDGRLDLAVAIPSLNKICILLNSTGPTAVEEEELVPNVFEVTQNFPNPFNPLTSFGYTVPKTTAVVVDVYNALGQKVRTLVDQTQTAGKYRVMWDGTDSRGHSVASGVYLYRVSVDGSTTTKKMLLLK